MKLTVTRAQDREAMARIVREIFAAAPDCNVETRPGYLGERSIAVEFRHARGLAVTVEFDGDSHLDRAGEFCMAWHISGAFVDDVYVPAEAQISDAFGAAMRSTVNPYHHRKCTAFGEGFDDLCSKLRTAISMLLYNTAYRRTA
jgi:hypothetical protein